MTEKFEGRHAIIGRVETPSHSPDPFHPLSTSMNAKPLSAMVNFTLFARLPCVHQFDPAF
jgi:hypothetical protein